jgi:peptidoglycan/xylan/chitin deacetylase (PgdA/CDA1 family)
MPSDSLLTFRFHCPAEADHLRWADGKEFCLPAAVVQRSGLALHLDAAGNLRLPADFVAADGKAAEAARLYAAFTDAKPVSARLPFSYQRVPPWVRSVVAGILGRWQRRRNDRWAAFPRWPIDLGADFLADLVSGEPSPFAGRRTPVLLTHDLDSPEGLVRLVDSFLSMEEAVGARSTSYLVPCAWPIDYRLLGELAQRGHGLGVHGYDHSNRTAFAEPAERRRRLEAARPLLGRYGARGYRAPSLLRTRALLRDLAALYAYDSSIPTAGGLYPVPNNGCASARPFMVEGVVEIPLSLPRDGTLRFLGYTAREIADLWIACAEMIADSGGVVVLLTHCEARFTGNSAMLAAYRRFLDYVAASDHFAWSTPDEVLHRWGAWPAVA